MTQIEVLLEIVVLEFVTAAENVKSQCPFLGRQPFCNYLKFVLMIFETLMQFIA